MHLYINATLQQQQQQQHQEELQQQQQQQQQHLHQSNESRLQQQQQQQQKFNNSNNNNTRHVKYNNSNSSSSNNKNNNSCYIAASAAILLCLLASGIAKTNAVPTDSRSVLQESPLKDNIASNTESATVLEPTQPKGQCLYDGALVSETSVVCEKQVGCRAIQKTGHCCPDYKCACEKDGKTYANGDKLVDPETPCTVCYCKGGEILCSSVTCFHRDDCTPKYITGRCCPEYDNCPVAAIMDTAVPTLNNSGFATTIAQPKPDNTANPFNGLNLNITIKEITKPTEIRITDENKAKPIHQMLKPLPTSSTTEAPKLLTTTAAATTTTTTTATAVAAFDEAQSIDSFAAEAQHKTTLTKINSDDIGMQSFKLNEQKTTVLHSIKSTVPSSLEDFGLNTEVANESNKINIKRENMPSTELTPMSAVEDLSSAEIIYTPHIEASTAKSAVANLQHNALEPEVASSDHIYQIILSTEGPNAAKSSTLSSYESVLTASSTEASVSSSTAETLLGISGLYNTTDAPAASTESTAQSTETISSSTETSLASSTEATNESSSTDAAISSTTSTHCEEEETPIMPESNPAYPSLPEDDFSLREPSFTMGETEDVTDAHSKDEQRSIVSDALKSSKHIDETNGSGDAELGSGAGFSTTEFILNSANKKLAPLLYSNEDMSGETAILNNTDFNAYKHDNGSGDSLEIDNMDSLMGSGSGAGDLLTLTKPKQKVKMREPTTPRPTKTANIDIDLDELSASGDDARPTNAEDPKLDAEVLKINDSKEDENATLGKTDTAASKASEVKAFVDNASRERVQRLYLHRVY